jgi:hypothetical protein
MNRRGLTAPFGNAADLPIGQCARVRLMVGLKTAKALGPTIAESFPLRAEVVIE